MLDEKKSECIELTDEELSEVVGGRMEQGVYDRAGEYINWCLEGEEQASAWNQINEMRDSKKKYTAVFVASMLDEQYDIPVSWRDLKAEGVNQEVLKEYYGGYGAWQAYRLYGIKPSRQ